MNKKRFNFKLPPWLKGFLGLVLFGLPLLALTVLANLKYVQLSPPEIPEEQIPELSDSTPLDRPASINEDDKTVAIEIDYGDVPREMQPFIREALEKRPKHILQGSKHISITHVYIKEDWAILAVARLDGPDFDPAHIGAGELNSSNILARKIDNQTWTTAMLGTEYFAELLLQAPDNFMSEDGRQVYLDMNREAGVR